MKNKTIPPGYLFTRRYSNYVFTLLFLLYLFDYADRMVVSSMFSYIQADLGINDFQSGWLVSIIYLTIGLMTFPISLVIDRWSRTKTIGIMAIVWSLATLLCAFTGNYVQLFLARVLIGFGEAGYAPGGSALISGMYPMEKRSKMMGLWNASIPIGSAIGVTVGGIIASSWGWKHAFGLVAIPGLFIAIMFLFVKDYKTVALSKVDEGNQTTRMERKDIIKEFARKPSVLFTYFAMTAIVFVTTALLVWLPKFFQVTSGMDPKKAGSLAGAVMMLALVGAPLGGYIIDRWRKTMPTARMIYPAISTFISALLLFLALYVFDGTIRIVTLFIFGIFIMQFISGAAAVTQDVIHPGLRATSYAIAVLVQNLLGSFTAPIALGRISDLTNIQTAVSILPFSLVLGALLFLIGARYYVRDLKKVAPVKLEVN